MKEKRFREIYSQGTISTLQIVVDTQTGVQYLKSVTGYAGGITPLLDRDGRPLLAAPEELREE